MLNHKSSLILLTVENIDRYGYVQEVSVFIVTNILS